MATSTGRIRPRAYGRRIWSQQEIINHLPELTSGLKAVEQEWLTTRHTEPQEPHTEPQVVAQYLLTFLKTLRPRDYRGGPHQAQLKLQTNILPSVLEDFAKISFRSVPLAVNRALIGWAEGRYHLKLLAHVPSSLEVLEMQSRGERIVTCFFKPQELLETHEGGRDAFVFALHDLIHADHFFHDPGLAEAQRDFYSECLVRYRSGEFTERLGDAAWADQFHYIISDMNSHPEHLRATLGHLLTTTN
jgi:hypothetical protein